MASKVARVIGLELNTDAVNNARLNAKRNGIDNIEFISGKAEIEVPLLLSRLASKYGLKNVVAVVDPPRAGLSRFPSLFLIKDKSLIFILALLYS